MWRSPQHSCRMPLCSGIGDWISALGKPAARREVEMRWSDELVGGEREHAERAAAHHLRGTTGPDMATAHAALAPRPDPELVPSPGAVLQRRCRGLQRQGQLRRHLPVDQAQERQELCAAVDSGYSSLASHSPFRVAWLLQHQLSRIPERDAFLPSRSRSVLGNGVVGPRYRHSGSVIVRQEPDGRARTRRPGREPRGAGAERSDAP